MLYIDDFIPICSTYNYVLASLVLGVIRNVYIGCILLISSFPV